MALYEYVCTTCGAPFEVRRAMTEPEGPVSCPGGHATTKRKLSSFASLGAPTAQLAPVGPVASGGGRCGGGRGCGRGR